MDKVINIAEIYKTKQLLQDVTALLEKMYALINDQIASLNGLWFISAEEFAELYGCSVKIALRIYNLPDFPSSDFGKTKMAEISAVREYFSKPRNKEYIRHWNSVA